MWALIFLAFSKTRERKRRISKIKRKEQNTRTPNSPRTHRKWTQEPDVHAGLLPWPNRPKPERTWVTCSTTQGDWNHFNFQATALGPNSTLEEARTQHKKSCSWRGSNSLYMERELLYHRTMSFESFCTRVCVSISISIFYPIYLYTTKKYERISLPGSTMYHAGLGSVRLRKCILEIKPCNLKRFCTPKGMLEPDR